MICMCEIPFRSRRRNHFCFECYFVIQSCDENCVLHCIQYDAEIILRPFSPTPIEDAEEVAQQFAPVRWKIQGNKREGKSKEKKKKPMRV